MPTRLQEFREQYPQYSDIDDEELAEQLRLRYYGAIPAEEYRSHIGLDPLPAEPTPPTIRDRINSFMLGRAKKADPLTTDDAPRETYRDPEGFEIDVTRPRIRNDDGSYSTESTIGVDIEGREYNIPSIVNGQRVSEEEAKADAERRMAEGWVFPNFDSIEEAELAAQRRSDSIEGARASAQEPGPAGLTRSQYGLIQDWLAPDPGTLKEDLETTIEAMPQRTPNPLLDQWFAGFDEYAANYLLPRSLELGKEIGARARGERTSRKRAVGKAGLALASAMEASIARDPQAYLDQLTDELQEILDERSERRQRSQATPFAESTERMMRAETFSQALYEFADDPIRIIAEISLRSLPNMIDIVPLAIAGGSVGGPWGFAAGIGMGSASMEYRARLTELIEKAGYDLNSAVDVIAIANNAELMRQFSRQAALESGIIGVVDATTGFIATKMLVPPAIKNAVASRIVNVVVQTGVQAVGGGTGELGAQTARGEGYQPGEILAEAVAEAGTVMVDIGLATLVGVRQQRTEQAISNATADLYEKLGYDMDETEEDTTEPEPPPIALPRLPGLADNEVEVGGTLYRFSIDREIPTDQGTAYDLTITMPGDQQVSVTLKAGESIETLINEILPHYQAGPGEPDDLEQYRDKARQLFDEEGVSDRAREDVRKAILANIGDQEAAAFDEEYGRLTDEAVANRQAQKEPEPQDEQDRIAQLGPAELFEEIRATRNQVIEIFDDESASPDDRNVALMGFQQLIRRAELDIDKLSPDLQEQAREALATIAKLPDAPAPTPPPKPRAQVSAPGYFDVRLKRREFRQRLDGMAAELIVAGGNMSTLNREEAYPGEFEETGTRTGTVISRMPSENPQWFQDIVTVDDMKMSVRQVEKAVIKAVQGDRLGVRQQRVIGAMLDEISGQRRTDVDHAREQLAQARERRRLARSDENLPAADNETQSGELFDEDEYDADMTADSRIIFELMEQATQAGIDQDVLEGLSHELQDVTDRKFIQALERLIHEHRDQAGPQEVAPQPAPIAPPRTQELTADEFEADLPPGWQDAELDFVAANKRIIEGMRIIEAGRLALEDKSMVSLRALAVKLNAKKARGKSDLADNIFRRSRELQQTAQRGPTAVPVVDPAKQEARTGEPFRATMWRGYGRPDIGKVYSTVQEPLLGRNSTYYAFDEKTASIFGTPQSVLVDLKNPMVISNDDEFRAWYATAGKPWYLNPFVQVDDPSDPEAVAKVTDWAQKMRQVAVDRGHDGIIIQWPDKDVGDFSEAVPEGWKRLGQVWGQSQVVVFEAPVPEIEGARDLFGEDRSKEQALADEIRRRDERRNQGQEEIETGDPTDLFSEARRQMDLEAVTGRPTDETRAARSDEELSEAGYLEKYGERRVDTERRINYDAMPTAELIDILYTDELTGIANRRAFQEEGEDHTWLASIDADSLKFINDTIGHDAGDAMLIAIAQALDQTGVDAYHISGDEFYLGADTRPELTAAIALAKATLATSEIRTGNGTKKGIEFTYGIGESKETADAAMNEQKRVREVSGKRTSRDSKAAPRGFSMTVSMEAPVNMEPGTNYQGFIGQHGDLPTDANRNYVLGNGTRVRIPKKPIRREHIISELRRRFGRKIFQGRVKGTTKLGFYRAGIGEIRIKHFNDIETVAHEVSHWFDDRYPWMATLYRAHRDEVMSLSYDSDKIWEGFAEFGRHWFTQDYKAYQAAPGFYEEFMAELDRQPKLRDNMLAIQELMHAWHLQGARARLASKIGANNLPLTDRFRDFYEMLPDKILQRVFDELRSFKQAERDIRGGVAAPEFSGYASFRLAKGLHGIILAITHKGAIGWTETGDIEFVGKALNDIFHPINKNLDKYVSYIVARRAEELTSQGRENLIRPDEIAAGLAYEADYPEFKTAFDEWLVFNSQMLDFYQASGLLSDESRGYIDEMNKNYVPFNRIADTIMGQRVQRGGGSPFMRLKGGTANVNDIMESIIGNMSYLVHMSLVNRGKQNFYRMILAQQGSIRAKPDKREGGNTAAGNWAAPISKDAVPALIHKEQVLKAVLEGMGFTMAWYNMAKQGFVQSDEEIVVVDMIDKMMGGMKEMVLFFQTGQDPKGAVDFYFEAGEKHFFEIIDPLLYESIAHLGPQNHNLAVSILGGFANVLRRGVVMTPTFQLKNLIRDTGNAFTLSKGKIVPLKDALVALMERIYNDEHYWLYMANGGGFASIAEAEGIQSDRIIDSPMKLFSMYDRGISSFEYANRIAEFKVLQRKGQTARVGALAGREISTDFAMHGSSDSVRVFTIAVPFLNARMQGFYRNARELAHMPPGERLSFAGNRAWQYALRSLMTITIPSLYLYAMNKDDDRYKEIPDWIRDLNWIIFTGSGEDDYVMIPKPFETGMIWGTIPERAIEYYYDRDEKELADAMLWMALQTFALDLTPQAFQPLLELRKNRKFTGAPIVPGYLTGVLPQEQWRYYTSDAMIALGRKYGISPMKAEHVVRGHFGTIGTWALGVADYMVGDLAAGGERPSWDPWRENIITSPFVNKGPLKRTDSEDELYELLQETREITMAMSQMGRRNPEFIAEFIGDSAERRAYMGLNELLVNTANDMHELRKQQDLIAGSTEMSGEEKRRIIDTLDRAKNKMAHEVRGAINPQMVRELIEQMERDLEQERIMRAVGAQ